MDGGSLVRCVDNSESKTLTCCSSFPEALVPWTASSTSCLRSSLSLPQDSILPAHRFGSCLHRAPFHWIFHALAQKHPIGPEDWVFQFPPTCRPSGRQRDTTCSCCRVQLAALAVHCQIWAYNYSAPGAPQSGSLSSSLVSGCHRRNRSFPLNLGVKKLLLASCNESGLCATGKIGANSSERVSDIYIAEYRQCERYHDNGCWMSAKIARPAGLISKICWNFVFTLLLIKLDIFCRFRFQQLCIFCE